jgi:hypothetical protein
MIGLTLVLSRSIDWTIRNKAQLGHGIAMAAALLSILLGVMILNEGLVGGSSP